MNSFDKQKLYELLCEIPRGKVVTYGKLAEMLGDRKWARAVGNALHSKGKSMNKLKSANRVQVP